jgi:radical SAM superfamily enzyme YgiQ (UPF0313 family)
MDGDTKTVFKETYDFIRDSELDSISMNIVIPMTGTKLQSRLKEEGRLLSEVINRETISKPLYIPKNMTGEELVEGYKWTINRLSRLSEVIRRLARVFFQRRDAFKITLAFNLAFIRNRKIVNELTKNNWGK